MFSREFETMRENKMRALQLERLKWSVSHAYENVPFYHQKYDATGFHPSQLKTLEDIRRIPFLTKQDMRENYPFGLFAVPRGKIVRVHASSGTTGNATVVGYTKQDVETFSEIVARCLVSYGAGPEDVVQVAYGYGLFTGGLGLHYAISGGNTARQVMLIRDLGTTIIACTPSYLLNIADYLEKKMPGFDLRSTRLGIAVLGAEPWTLEMRREIEQRLGISAYDIYGLSEYMYAYAHGQKDQAVMIFRFDNIEAAKEALASAGFRIVRASDITWK